MGANYISLQVPETPTAVIRHALQSFNAQNKEGLRAWIGPPIGRWTAIYPQFSPEMELFAKRLSATTKGIVLAIGAFDEDDLYCNICELGKDHGYFKVSVGRKRSGKQREPVIKKLGMLAAYTDAAARAALVETLCDLRDATFIRDSLIGFCETFQIANARCSYEYIQAGDYKADLDQVVDLELVTPSS